MKKLLVASTFMVLHSFAFALVGFGFQGGNLNFIDGSHRFLSNSVYKIKPEVGDFYFFPHYLMHTVYPFKDTDEERRSISFNAYIDDDIHNVWGR